jgi:hypothetical protein
MIPNNSLSGENDSGVFADAAQQAGLAGDDTRSREL